MSRASLWEATRRYVDAGLNLEVFVAAPYVGFPCESLNSVRTYVRFVCEGVTEILQLTDSAGLPDLLRDQIKFAYPVLKCRIAFSSPVNGQSEASL